MEGQVKERTEIIQIWIKYMEKINYVRIDATDQQGNALIGKNNKPYSRQTLKVESRGDRYISGFLNEGSKDFAVGDEVDIVITESEKLDKNGKPYLNWSLPKKGAVDSRLMQDIYENTETILNRLTGLSLDMQRVLDRVTPPKKNNYPVNDVPPPFEDDEIDLSASPF